MFSEVCKFLVPYLQYMENIHVQGQGYLGGVKLENPGTSKISIFETLKLVCSDFHT